MSDGEENTNAERNMRRRDKNEQLDRLEQQAGKKRKERSPVRH